MHEFSLCQGLVEAVLAELGKLDPLPIRVRKVRVVAGALRQIVPDVLTFAYEQLVKDTAAAGSQLELMTLPVRVRCPSCGWEGAIDEALFQCGGCGSSSVELRSGRELYLDQLEVDVDG